MDNAVDQSCSSKEDIRFENDISDKNDCFSEKLGVEVQDNSPNMTVTDVNNYSSEEDTDMDSSETDNIDEGEDQLSCEENLDENNVIYDANKIVQSNENPFLFEMHVGNFDDKNSFQSHSTTNVHENLLKGDKNVRPVTDVSDKSNEEDSDLDSSDKDNDQDKDYKLPSEENTFTCEICQENFRDKSIFQQHLTAHAIENMNEVETQCIVPDKPNIHEIGSNSLSDKPHLATPRKDIACPVTQNSDVSGKTGTSVCDRPFVCEICSKAFKTKRDLKKHILTHTRPHLCEVCNKKFSLRRLLECHLMTHTLERPYGCDLCHKTFKCSIDLRKHVTTHSNKGTHICDVCGKAYASKRNLKIHYIDHTQEMPFECETCKRKFKRKDDLKKHSASHQEVKAFVCDICNKGFHVKDYLNRHYLTHTSEKRFICEMCDEGFTKLRYLKNHYSTHILEKHFICQVCNRGFSTEKYLQNHMLIHTNERLHTCEVCGQAFTLKKYLKNHYLTHNSNRQICEECNKSFRDVYSLRMHYKTHTTEKPFECHVCNNKFKMRKTLNKHVQVFHPDQVVQETPAQILINNP